MTLVSRFFRSGIVRISGTVLLVAAVGLGGYLGFLRLSGNFHTVIAGELYRSAQPTPAQMESYVRDHGIKTIVNLRGPSDNAKWYIDEIATAKRLGVEHVDFQMSASQKLSPSRADQLVAIMKDAPKPILVHCQAGADRSGLVSVIYSEQIAGVSEGDAERQLSILFGHIGIPVLSSTFAMDESWEDLEQHFMVHEAQKS